MTIYIKHLIKLNRKMTAYEDILTHNGALLIRKDCDIGSDVFDKLIKFNLKKPIEDSVMVDEQINADKLYCLFAELLKNHPCFMAIDNSIAKPSLLKSCCALTDKFFTLQQKLTVLQAQLPEVFKQSIFCTYLVCVYAAVNQLSEEDTQAYFLSALFHDIGFVHIDYSVIHKSGSLSTKDWKVIQSHPVVAVKILKNIPDFPKKAISAILEHHESSDGTGFPAGKPEAELGQLGRLLYLLDSVTAIYNKRLNKRGLSIRSVLSILQANAGLYSPDILPNLVSVLKHAPEAGRYMHNYDSLKALIDRLSQKQIYVNNIAKIIKSFDENTEILNKKSLKIIRAYGLNIINTVDRAGLNYIDYSKEIDCFDDEKLTALSKEVEDANAIVDELVYQIFNYNKQLGQVINLGASKKVSQLLHAVKEAIQKDAPKLN